MRWRSLSSGESPQQSSFQVCRRRSLFFQKQTFSSLHLSCSYAKYSKDRINSIIWSQLKFLIQSVNALDKLSLDLGI